MRITAINGSPRRNGNTAALLKEALKGAASQNAETELIHLYDLDYKGCVSCFACKQKGNAGPGYCAYKDALTPVLETIMSSDAVLVGSPIYLSELTGMTRSFLEQLIFMNITYDEPYRTAPGKSISSAFFFTMNLPKEAESYYLPLFENNSKTLGYLGGTTEYLASFDTYQFDDYSKYASGIFDEAHKKEVRDTQFPLDLEKAYEIGARLAGAKVIL